MSTLGWLIVAALSVAWVADVIVAVPRVTLAINAVVTVVVLAPLLTGRQSVAGQAVLLGLAALLAAVSLRTAYWYGDPADGPLGRLAGAKR